MALDERCRDGPAASGDASRQPSRRGSRGGFSAPPAKRHQVGAVEGYTRVLRRGTSTGMAQKSLGGVLRAAANPSCTPHRMREPKRRKTNGAQTVYATLPVVASEPGAPPAADVISPSKSPPPTRQASHWASPSAQCSQGARVPGTMRGAIDAQQTAAR